MSESTSTGKPDFAAFLAVDWADRQHTWALQVAGSTQRERGTLEHTPEAIEAWALQWATRFPGRPVAVALEQARGALVYALSKYQHLVLYPIHPSTSKRFRQAMFPSGSKDDPKDADLLLELLMHHRDRLRALHPDSEPIRKLQLLVERRRQAVDEKTAHSNRITDLLKLYFPQARQWFDAIDSPIATAFLQRWSTLQQAQQEDPEELRRFFQAHCCRPAAIAARLEQIRQARPVIEDAAIIEPAVLTLRVWLAVVEALRQGIATLQRAIQEVAASHPDYPIFASFPAAGPTMAPRLLAAFGSQRERYASANQLQSFSGIAPVKEASGSRQWVHCRWACPKFVRQTFHEYAALTIPRCEWAKRLYQQHKAAGKRHHAAVRSLAFKWMRILFRCWQARTAYDPQRFADAQQKHRLQAAAVAPPTSPNASSGRPLSSATLPRTADGSCARPVDFQFKTTAGFWKFAGATT